MLPIHGQTDPAQPPGSRVRDRDAGGCRVPGEPDLHERRHAAGVRGQAGVSFFAGRYSVGLWFWEVSRFPERWRGSFSLLEEVWAPTAHVAAALEPMATVPVDRSGSRWRLRRSRCSRAELGLPQDDIPVPVQLRLPERVRRKNPLAVIEAFGRAFAPGEGAHLVLKCINHDRDPDAHTPAARVSRAASRRHRDRSLHVAGRQQRPHVRCATATSRCTGPKGSGS